MAAPASSSAHLLCVCSWLLLDRDDEPMTHKVLVVEDEPALVDTLEYNLLKARLRSRHCHGRRQGAGHGSPRAPVVVLDIMLP